MKHNAALLGKSSSRKGNIFAAKKKALAEYYVEIVLKLHASQAKFPALEPDHFIEFNPPAVAELGEQKINPPIVAELDGCKMNPPIVAELGEPKTNSSTVIESGGFKVNPAAVAELDGCKINPSAIAELGGFKRNLSAVKKESVVEIHFPLIVKTHVLKVYVPSLGAAISLAHPVFITEAATLETDVFGVFLEDFKRFGDVFRKLAHSPVI
ncbi:MAG: hypothetical protein ACE5GQ_03625 [Nitrospinales bacterium]